MESTCPTCDRTDFESLASHWATDCHSPPFDAKQRSLLDGAILGGGQFVESVIGTDNYSMEIESSTPEPLEDIEAGLGAHACSVTEQTRRSEFDEWVSEFLLRIRASDRVSAIRSSWTDDIQQLSIPEEFDFDPTIGRIWYLLAGEVVQPGYTDQPAVKLALPSDLTHWDELVLDCSQEFSARLWTDGILIEDSTQFFEWIGIDPDGVDTHEDETTESHEQLDEVAEAHVENPTETAVGSTDDPLLPEEPMIDIHSVPHLNEVLTGFAQRLSALSQGAHESGSPGVAELSKDPREERLDRLESDLEEVRELFDFDEGQNDGESTTTGR